MAVFHDRIPQTNHLPPASEVMEKRQIESDLDPGKFNSKKDFMNRLNEVLREEELELQEISFVQGKIVITAIYPRLSCKIPGMQLELRTNPKWSDDGW